MPNDDEDTTGCREIRLTPEAEERLQILARAQTGDLEPMARYIERFPWLMPEVREFIAAHLRGQLKFKPGARLTIDQLLERSRNLRRFREIVREQGVSHEEAREILADELGISDETLRWQLKKARTEEFPAEVVIGPQYKPDPRHRK
jgi:hypothetical protein